MDKLKNKIALLTGGTGGLGKTVLRNLLAEGAITVCVYIDEEELRECMPLLQDYKSKLMFLKADLTKEKQVTRVVRKTLDSFGRIDLLINTIGGFKYAPILNTELKDVQQMMGLNFKNVFLTSKEVLPQMIEQNYGRIVTVSSRPALHGVKGIGAYAASKSAVLNLTETMADEMMDYDININAILPSTIDTEQNRKDMPEADFSKWVKPEEISKVIIFLLSDDSKAITGAAIPVYGRA